MKSEEQEKDRSRITDHGSRLSLIVAVAKNGVIGADNAIPWHLPAELQIFKRVTTGHHIIMGRKTWESIGRLLPGRTTVIVTRQQNYQVPGAIVAQTLDDAMARCVGDDEVFVIGGAELFRSALPIADRLYLTIVETAPQGDTFMPEIDIKEWREVSSEVHAADDRNAISFRYAVFDRASHTSTA